ncbi:MAG: SMI1/KNR4 family protein [Cytophagaceae bacterium]|nr:SMI1/KNR4 family protein [Cytophagaceae bacterium]
MEAIEKLKKIIDWYALNKIGEVRFLNEQNDLNSLQYIENLLDEPLPHDIYSIYRIYNGEKGKGYGAFLGHSFVSIQEMMNSLEFSKTLIKPNNPKVPNQEKANELIQSIIEIVQSHIPRDVQPEIINEKWYKIEFECSPTSRSGPYFYPSKETTGKDRQIIKIPFGSDSEKRFSEFVKELHALELNDYNWDNIEIIVFGNGDYEVNRAYFNFDNTLPLTSYPDGAIKKKYFHIKWIPIISDYSGNYIGIDLDPDEKGIKGQVIVFGRDEEDMFVIANSWNEFLELTLKLISTQAEFFLSESHLHKILKDLIVSQKNK